jgi:hypothetical protein
MMTYTSIRNLFGKLVNDASSTTLTLGDTLINTSYREILASQPWAFLEASTTQLTVASQQNYLLPYNCSKITNVTVLIGTVRYVPKQITSREEWDFLNLNSAIRSNIPVFWYQWGGQVYLWPTPSAAGNTITINYKKQIRDLSKADYTTQQIVTATNGSTAIVGSSTAWTTDMAGRWLQIGISATSNAKNGDGMWYEIASIDSATTLTLVKPYGGTSVTLASDAYIIGDLPLISEEYQILPIYRACQIFFSSVQPDATKAELYKGLYTDQLASMKITYGSKSTSPVLKEDDIRVIDPNALIWK